MKQLQCYLLKNKLLLGNTLFWLLFTPLLCAQGWCFEEQTVVLESLNNPVSSETIIYKNAVSIDEISIPQYENLYLQVYYPTNLQANEQRPLIALIHGGFFIGGSYTDFSPIAEELAKAGFIAATIGYRLCHRVDCELADLITPCNVSWGYSLLPSAYVAMLDVSDGIRYLQNNASQYHINPNNIMVGGHSAGALTTLHLAFLDADELAEICPGCGTWPDYLAETYQPVNGIKAIFPMSGSIYDINWIDADEASAVSTLLMHGTADGIVSYDDTEMVQCCPGTPFTAMSGSCSIAQRLNLLGANYELLSGINCTHDVNAGSFLEASKAEVAAFAVKSLICQHDIQKHVTWTCQGLAMCPPFPFEAGTPATVCDLGSDLPFNVWLDAENPSTSLPHFKAFIYNETLKIEHSLYKDAQYSIRLIDLNAKVLVEQKMLQNQLEIDLKNYPSGIYLAQLLGNERQILAVQKMVK